MCSCSVCCPTARAERSNLEADIRSNLSNLDSIIARSSCCEKTVYIPQSTCDTKYDALLLSLQFFDKRKRSCSCYGRCHCLAKRRSYRD